MTAKYSPAGVVAAVCSDTIDKIIHRITFEGDHDTDKLVADLGVVARALAKLAREEGLPWDVIVSRVRS